MKVMKWVALGMTTAMIVYLGLLRVKHAELTSIQFVLEMWPEYVKLCLLGFATGMAWGRR